MVVILLGCLSIGMSGYRNIGLFFAVVSGSRALLAFSRSCGHCCSVFRVDPRVCPSSSSSSFLYVFSPSGVPTLSGKVTRWVCESRLPLSFFTLFFLSLSFVLIFAPLLVSLISTPFTQSLSQSVIHLFSQLGNYTDS